MGKRLPYSIRKFIRKEKARIRSQILDIEEQKRLISQLYQKFFESPEIKNSKAENKKSAEVKES